LDGVLRCFEGARLQPRRKSRKKQRRLYRLRKNSILFLLLGGAAVHRCDTSLVFGDGYEAAEGGGARH